MTQRLLALLVAFAAGLGSLVEWERAQARQSDDAVMALRTARLGPTTRARLGTWFRAVHPETLLVWRGYPAGLMDERSLVELVTTRDETTHVYRFAVRVDDRDVEPLDPKSAALVERVLQWARP